MLTGACVGGKWGQGQGRRGSGSAATLFPPTMVPLGLPSTYYILPRLEYATSVTPLSIQRVSRAARRHLLNPLLLDVPPTGMDPGGI
jgi:hypothetical protein